jgi:phosphomannomutase
VNLSTTAAWEEVAAGLGVRIVRTKIGELNVAAGMMQKNTVLGAEGNGGVLLAPVNYGRNSTVAIILLLYYCVYTGKTINQLEQDLPGYVLVKEKKQTADPARALKRIGAFFRKRKNVVKVDSRDGYKVLFKDRSWLQVRASNTEPIVRIFAETRVTNGKTAARQAAARLIAGARKVIG